MKAKLISLWVDIKYFFLKIRYRNNIPIEALLTKPINRILDISEKVSVAKKLCELLKIDFFETKLCVMLSYAINKDHPNNDIYTEAKTLMDTDKPRRYYYNKLAEYNDISKERTLVVLTIDEQNKLWDWINEENQS